MNKKFTIFIMVILISSCSGITKKKQVVQSIETNIEKTEPETRITNNEDNTYIPLIEDDQDTNKELLAKNLEILTPDLFIDGVAHPGQLGKNQKIYYLKGAEDLNLQNNYFDIPVVYNDQVKKWIVYFTTKGRKYFSLYVERAGRYAPMIGTILEKNNLPRDLIFLAMAESGFNNHAKSFAAAVGPWQFMPATGKSYSLNQNWYIDERKDPIKATVAAAQYLGKLYEDFGQWEVATAAYNAGEGKLGRAIRKYKTDNFWKITKGKYLKSETKNYVPKIMALAIIGKNLKTFGFTDLEFRAPLEYEEITVKPMTDISKLSKALGLNDEDVKKLNPEILRWFTPPNVKNYKLRLPIESAQKYTICCSMQNFSVTNFQKYKVKRKISLHQLSRKFNLRDSFVLSHINSIPIKTTLSKGMIINLPFKMGDKTGLNNRYYAGLYAKIPKRMKFKVKIHRVKRGESLYSIAKKHKTTISRIIAFNNSIPSSKKVFPGTKLVIR